MESPPPNEPSGDPSLQPAQLPSAVRPKRRWPWIIGGILLFLLLVLLFLPTLLGTRVGRPILIAYINQQLNGRVEIQDCSMGWLSGMQINGLAVFDTNGRQILQAIHISTGLTFPNALRGPYRLGDVRAEQLDVLVSREPDGSINWDRLIKLDSSWRQAGQSITGEIHVDHGSSTYEDRFDPSEAPVYLRSIEGTLKIPAAGGTLTDAFSAAAQVGNETSGTAQLMGSFSFVVDRKSKVNQTLTTRGMDVAVVSRQLGPGWKMVRSSNDGAVFQFDGTASPTKHATPLTQPR